MGDVICAQRNSPQLLQMSPLVIPRSHNVCAIMNPPRLQPALIGSVIAAFQSWNNLLEQWLPVMSRQGALPLLPAPLAGCAPVPAAPSCCLPGETSPARGQLVTSKVQWSPWERTVALWNETLRFSWFYCHLCLFCSSFSM